MRSRVVAAAMFGTAAMVTAAGCSSSFFEPLVDLAGSWTLAPDGGSSIVFLDDHTFVAKDLPSSIVCAHRAPPSQPDACSPGGPARVDLSGTWELHERNAAEIYFDDGEQLVMEGFRYGDNLGFWTGDKERPDPTYEYIHD